MNGELLYGENGEILIPSAEDEDPDKGKRSRSIVVDVALVVLLALGVGFGLGLFQDNGNAQATTPQSRSYDVDFLQSVIGEDSPASPPGAAFPHIVYEDGVLFVRGVVADQATADAAIARLEPLFGEGNVIPEIVVDANFADDPNAPTSVYFAENVLFDSGSAEIEPQFLDILGVSASFLEITDETMIAISGHTDSNGDDLSNLSLSQARVDAARQAMIEAGGDPDRITAEGFGESQPIADNTTALGRQQNRRVELQIIDGLIMAEDEG